MITKNLVISSENLPPEASLEKWQNWARSLWIFCHILKSAFEEKFHDLGRIHFHLCNFLDPEKNPSGRKFVSMFRGSFKTTIILALCLYLFCWSVLTGEPISIIYNTATRENAQTFMEDFREALLKCKLLHWIFGIPTKSNEYKKWTQWRIWFKESRFQVASLETRQVSRHAKVIINDDLVNDDNAYSAVERETVLRKWKLQKSILTKYKKKKVGLEIDVGTPFHHSDLISHLIKNVKTYDKFIMPYKIRTQDGKEILSFPELFTQEDFDEIREDQGASIFATQYELMVIDDADRICYEQWLKRWVWLPENYYRYLIIDPAGTEDKKKNDPTGYVVADVCDAGRIYVVYAEQLWVTPYRALKHMEALQESFAPDETYVEKEKYSISMLDTSEHLAPKLNFSFVEHENQEKGKRIRKLKQYFETGRLLIGPNMKDLENQIINYPGVEHDDLLDALSYVLKVMVIPKKGVAKDIETKHEKDFYEEIQKVKQRLEKYRQGEDLNAYF